MRLERKRAGDQLSASKDWNPVVEYINSEDNYRPVEGVTDRLHGYTDVDLDTYSLFGISDDSTWADPVKFSIGAADEAKPMYTTGPLAVPGSSMLHAEPLVFGKLYVLRITGDVPEIGKECGPDPDDYGVSKIGHGMFCISISDDETLAACVRIRADCIRYAWATTTSTVEPDDTTFTVTSIIPDDGSEWDGDDPLTVQNQPLRYRIDSGVQGSIIYRIKHDNSGDRAWYADDFSPICKDGEEP